MNDEKIGIAALCLAVGIVIGLAVGYAWGFNNGKQVNTINFGPDLKLQWKTTPQPQAK